MRALFVMAAGVAAVAVYAARVADHNTVAVVADAHPPVAAGEPSRQRASGRSVILQGDGQGHFQVEADVDGQRIPFMVDTGASLVILRESDAAALGIHPVVNDYTATVSTANGRIKAAPAKLGRVEIEGIEVDDVDALVLPDAALGRNLLGVSFLSRLSRYQYANGRMVLEQ
jgi:aspartyl protease family protein